MHNRYLGTALLCLALAALPAAAANKKHAAAKKPAEPEAIVTDVKPPSGSWEQTPAPNKDYVWSKGYYEWKDGRYQWKGGEWVLKQEGKTYEQHAWKQRPDGKWELTGGKFVSDDEAKKKDDDAKDASAAKKEDTRSMGAGAKADGKPAGTAKR